MNDSEIEALATAITNELLNAPNGQKGEYLTLFAGGVLGTMSKATIRQRIEKVIRHHLETSTAR